DQVQAEKQITKGLRQLLAVAENYTQLNANQNFLALQEELTSTESKIAYARQFYNDEVALLNTRVQSFPSNLVARAGKFQPRHFFEIHEPATRPVSVEFQRYPLYEEIARNKRRSGASIVGALVLLGAGGY